MRAWPHRIRAVAFDLDGLMLNTEELYFDVGQEILGRRGKVFRSELRRGMMGLPGPKAFQLMIDQESLSDRWEDLQSESDEIFRDILAERVAPMPGLLPLLDHLDKYGIPRCVATSSRESFARTALGYCGLETRIDFFVTAEHVVFGKPHPDIYLLAAKKFGIDPNGMLILEDSGHGTRAGVDSQACVISVPGEHSRDHDFSGAFGRASRLDDPIVMNLFD